MPCKTSLFHFRTTKVINLGVLIFRIFTIMHIYISLTDNCSQMVKQCLEAYCDPPSYLPAE